MAAVKKILAAVLGALMVFGAAVALPLPDRIAESKTEELPPASVSRLYREAELILIATCMRTGQTEDGAPAARFSVDRVLDGSEKAGVMISLVASASPGVQYLLYVRHSGEETGPAYRLVTAEPIPVDAGRIAYEGETCSIESIENDIKRQSSILTVPAQSFFYGELGSLASACDEIVVARVLSVSGPTETVCRSTMGGESTLATLDQVFLRIRVENGLYGALRYGDKLNVVLSPYYVRPVINATDLTAKTVGAPPERYPTAGNVYVFFLLRSEDPRSDRYFTVNPYEGYVRLVGGNVIRPYYNTAMRDMNDLSLFSRRLKAALGAEEQ